MTPPRFAPPPPPDSASSPGHGKAPEPVLRAHKLHQLVVDPSDRVFSEIEGATNSSGGKSTASPFEPPQNLSKRMTHKPLGAWKGPLGAGSSKQKSAIWKGHEKAGTNFAPGLLKSTTRKR